MRSYEPIPRSDVEALARSDAHAARQEQHLMGVLDCKTPDELDRKLGDPIAMAVALGPTLYDHCYLCGQSITRTELDGGAIFFWVRDEGWRHGGCLESNESPT